MNLLQELQTRTATAQKATPEEVKGVYEVIVDQCLAEADMGSHSTYVDVSDIEADFGPLRASSFNDAFTRAMKQIADAGVDFKRTGDEVLLEWRIGMSKSHDGQIEVVLDIETDLNNLMDQYDLTNDHLKEILQQIIVDIDRGFVGEPC
jgi:hypothetical protein